MPQSRPRIMKVAIATQQSFQLMKGSFQGEQSQRLKYAPIYVLFIFHL